MAKIARLNMEVVLSNLIEFEMKLIGEASNSNFILNGMPIEADSNSLRQNNGS